jgi:hypothetical protein
MDGKNTAGIGSKMESKKTYRTRILSISSLNSVTTCYVGFLLCTKRKHTYTLHSGILPAISPLASSFHQPILTQSQILIN